jgi:hypothetical protein
MAPHGPAHRSAAAPHEFENCDLGRDAIETAAFADVTRPIDDTTRSASFCSMWAARPLNGGDTTTGGSGGLLRRTVRRHGWRRSSDQGWLERVRRDRPPVPPGFVSAKHPPTGSVSAPSSASIETTTFAHAAPMDGSSVSAATRRHVHRNSIAPTPPSSELGNVSGIR